MRRTERRAGQLLAEMPKNSGKLRNSSPSHDGRATAEPPTLDALGVTRSDSSRWQKLASIDEVKDIRDKSEAMAAYARQAKDTELLKWATEIKVRAERRAGQLLAEMPKNPGELRNSSRYHDGTATTPTLSDLGITKNDSSRWQKLASIDEEKFEAAVAAAKDKAGEVTTAASRKPRCTMPKATTSTECTSPCTSRRSSGTSHFWLGKYRRCTAQCRQQAVTAAL